MAPASYDAGAIYNMTDTHNSLHNTTRVLYRLKRLYGVPVTLRRYTANDTDIETGVIESTYTESTIRRAIVTTIQAALSFVYDLSFIAANKNFTYGGFFENTDRVVIIDLKDHSTQILHTDKIIYQGNEYDIIKMIPSDISRAMLLVIRYVSNITHEVEDAE